MSDPRVSYKAQASGAAAASSYATPITRKVEKPKISNIYADFQREVGNDAVADLYDNFDWDSLEQPKSEPKEVPIPEGGPTVENAAKYEEAVKKSNKFGYVTLGNRGTGAGQAAWEKFGSLTCGY